MGTLEKIPRQIEIIVQKAVEHDSCILPDQIAWIVKAMDQFADEKLQEQKNGLLPTSRYEVRIASNGDECIMLKDLNVRIATFSKGTKQDAIAINKLITV